jgi:hypothetical protein
MSQKRKHARNIRFASQHLMRKANRAAARLDKATNKDLVEFYDLLYTDLSNAWMNANKRYTEWEARNGYLDDDWSPMDDSRNYYRYEACMSVGDYEGANDCFR